jgi:thimet oligopeptidase
VIPVAAAPTQPPTPPPAPPEQPEGFLAACRQGIEAARSLLDGLLAIQDTRTAQNTLVPYNDLLIELSNASARASLYANVHPDTQLRTAAETCEQEVSSFATDLELNRGLFDAFTALDASGLDAGARRLVEKTLEGFARSGVDKDDATRARLKQLADELLQLGQTFDRNIRDDVRQVSLDPAQLAGLPQDYVAAHPPGADGKVVITTNNPDSQPFLAYAEDDAARRAVFVEFQQRGYPANEQVLRQLLAARKERANLVGYADWADFITADKMVGSADSAQGFIDDVMVLSEARAEQDYAMLLEQKRTRDAAATVVDQSERLFYEEQVKRAQYQFDSQEVRPYFEFTQTRDGMLAVTSRLFDVEYVGVADAPVWHPDVDVYDVLRGGEKLGRIYLDLHPREGKYQHAAQFTVVNGVAGRQLPEGALVTNFPNPATSEGPALMEHRDVVTMFHEFGHLLHHILGGQQPWLSFSGVATEWDFVEAPSQMLEEWAWDTETLQLFAKHVETQQPIPPELVERLRGANEFASGTWVQHQMYYAALSLAFHRLADPLAHDLDATMVALQEQYSPFAYVDGTHFYTNFGHLNGYSAMYYTYMWSLVIAKDLFGEFAANGLYDEATARRYREEVLAPGGSQDAAVLVEDFLGRPYTLDAFAEWLNPDNP